MYQIIFVCRTCEDKNKHHLGIEGFELLQTKFESLTEIVNDHVIRGHNVYTEIRSEDD